MDKNWLIRTKSNHILGPVSKEKVLELYRNNSIKPDDEICAGNGFWFFIREDDMISRFLTGNEVQGFNPISEAKDILTAHDSDEPQKPSGKEDATFVGGISLDMLASSEVPPIEDIPSGPPEDHSGQTPPPAPAPEEHPEPKKKSRPEKVLKHPAAAHVAKTKHLQVQQKRQNYLKWIGIFCFIVLFSLIYYRKKIIQTLFKGEVTLIELSLINEVHAQEVIPQKKNF